MIEEVLLGSRMRGSLGVSKNKKKKSQITDSVIPVPLMRVHLQEQRGKGRSEGK